MLRWIKYSSINLKMLEARARKNNKERTQKKKIVKWWNYSINSNGRMERINEIYSTQHTKKKEQKSIKEKKIYDLFKRIWRYELLVYN
jgi:RNA polymerase-interacting CarD/CdnL/TRCF family regulator